MVLDQPSSFPSDPDSPPNSYQEPSSSNYADIDFTQLPHPLMFPDSLHIRSIKSELKNRAAMIHRPLTPEETAASAYYSAKYNKTVTYGGALGTFFAWTIHSHTPHKEYHFPFLGSMKSENGWFNGERIRVLGWEVMRGAPARWLVRVPRFLNFGLWGSILGTGLGSMYAGAVRLVYEDRDPRLKDVTKARRARVDEWTEKRRQQRQQRLDRRAAIIGNVEANQDDDGTPEMRNSEAFRNEDPIGSYWKSQPAYTPSKPSSSVWTEEDPPSRSNASTSNITSSAGSAWDRIRRESVSTDLGSPKTRRDPGMRTPNPESSTASSDSSEEEAGAAAPPPSDDFSISSAELEKGYAREDAQRDFDARVEKERRGGDFSSEK